MHSSAGHREITPTVIFASFISVWGIALAFSGYATAWFYFFTGLYPSTSHLGRPGFRYSEEPAVIYWGVFMAFLYLGFLILGYRRRSALPAWVAVILIFLSGVGGFVRSLYGIEG